MRTIVQSTKYRRNLRLLRKRGLDLAYLVEIVDIIAEHGAPPPHTRPHLLSGNWAGHWECHVDRDWLLIYRVSDDTVELIRTGTHSDLF